MRNLLRSPGFSISVVTVLGVALGANAAALTLLDKLVLRPLPVKEPSRLVKVDAPHLPEGSRKKGGPVVVFVGDHGRKGMSYPLYKALRDRVPVFTGVLAKLEVNAT